MCVYVDVVSCLEANGKCGPTHCSEDAEVKDFCARVCFLGQCADELEEIRTDYKESQTDDDRRFHELCYVRLVPHVEAMQKHVFRNKRMCDIIMGRMRVFTFCGLAS